MSDNNALAVSLFGEILMADQLARARLTKALPKGMERRPGNWKIHALPVFLAVGYPGINLGVGYHTSMVVHLHFPTVIAQKTFVQAAL